MDVWALADPISVKGELPNAKGEIEVFQIQLHALKRPPAISRPAHSRAVQGGYFFSPNFTFGPI